MIYRSSIQVARNKAMLSLGGRKTCIPEESLLGNPAPKTAGGPSYCQRQKAYDPSNLRNITRIHEVIQICPDRPLTCVSGCYIRGNPSHVGSRSLSSSI